MTSDRSIRPWASTITRDRLEGGSRGASLPAIRDVAPFAFHDGYVWTSTVTSPRSSIGISPIEIQREPRSVRLRFNENFRCATVHASGTSGGPLSRARTHG